jgi:alkylation response protein AidB-like acyl-CoA dehydrogenase
VTQTAGSRPSAKSTAGTVTVFGAHPGYGHGGCDLIGTMLLRPQLQAMPIVYGEPRMDLSLSPEELEFRDEIRTWLRDHHPGPGPAGIEENFDFRLAWQRTLHEAGYAGIAWPKEYGGRGATPMEQTLFNEELVRSRVPAPANILGLIMGGPVVMAYGTEAQKQRFLAPILSGVEVWCQGFSEPDAGSDLAAVSTRGERVEGGWKITGQKVWTSFAHRAHWCMLLARTTDDARYRNLTYFICAMQQPGVTVRPLRQITGETEFSEVFFDAAFVADENIIGSTGDGWRIALATLMFERPGLGAASALGIRMDLGQLAELIRSRGLETDSAIRRRFARLVAQTETIRLNGYRGLARAGDGVPGPEGSIIKIQWASINQAVTELAFDVLGDDALVDGSPWTYRLLRARANSIEGGTSEIQRNILAERVLALPRMR